MSSIEWTNETWNPVIGCRRVSEGCQNCYAETMAKRLVHMERARISKQLDYRAIAARRQAGEYEHVVRMKGCPACGGEAIDGCETCYSLGGVPQPRWNGRAVFLPERLDQPLRWRKPRRVFVNSMSDLFHEDLTFEQIAEVFGVMGAASKHEFQVLTKRPARMLEFFRWLEGQQHGPLYYLATQTTVRHAIGDVGQDLLGDRPWPLPNVWGGVSCEDQKAADERIAKLLQCSFALRFVSAEPLLGKIDLPGLRCPDCGYSAHDARIHLDHRLCAKRGCSKPKVIDWIIVGGESGPGARPCDVAWVRSIVNQCREAGVACFVKQLGAKPVDPDGTGCAFTGGHLSGLVQHECGLPECEDHGCQYGFPALKDRKGGDPDEWPEDLRVREFPEAS